MALGGSGDKHGLSPTAPVRRLPGPIGEEGFCLARCVGALPLIRGPVCNRWRAFRGGAKLVGLFTGLRALGLYEGALQEMIHRVKYDGNRELVGLRELLQGR